MTRSTALGWTPHRGDRVEVWVTPPAWGSQPPHLTLRWDDPVRFLAQDGGPAGADEPRWVLQTANGPAYVPKATSSLHAVDADDTLF